jgi:hypothetical protein
MLIQRKPKVIAEKFGHLSADKQAVDIKIPVKDRGFQKLADAVVAGTSRPLRVGSILRSVIDWLCRKERNC